MPISTPISLTAKAQEDKRGQFDHAVPASGPRYAALYPRVISATPAAILLELNFRRASSESCFPLEATPLLTRARQVADGRVVAGVHYESDTETGIDLGDLLSPSSKSNPSSKMISPRLERRIRFPKGSDPLQSFIWGCA